ncbi:hypothetical protein Q9L58_008684 [Maublancomyces gigas]|uniref:Uncharacterized protein n=1 Tax=Discina gigas TaxID=1032678 RepID=A0ABR3G9B9_9PEZI
MFHLYEEVPSFKVRWAGRVGDVCYYLREIGDDDGEVWANTALFWYTKARMKPPPWLTAPRHDGITTEVEAEDSYVMVEIKTFVVIGPEALEPPDTVLMVVGNAANPAIAVSDAGSE